MSFGPILAVTFFIFFLTLSLLGVFWLYVSMRIIVFSLLIFFYLTVHPMHGRVVQVQVTLQRFSVGH